MWKWLCIGLAVIAVVEWVLLDSRWTPAAAPAVEAIPAEPSCSISALDQRLHRLESSLDRLSAQLSERPLPLAGDGKAIHNPSSLHVETLSVRNEAMQLMDEMSISGIADTAAMARLGQLLEIADPKSAEQILKTFDARIQSGELTIPRDR